METKNIGLRGIEVADTRISNIDGEKGKLIYRGFDILDLTKNSTFEETAYLLLYDQLPNKLQLDEFNSKLIEARYIPKQMQKNMGTADRAIRFIIAAVIGVLYYTGTISGTLGIVLLVLAGVFLLTSFISFCPLYAPFGLSTCPAKKP